MKFGCCCCYQSDRDGCEASRTFCSNCCRCPQKDANVRNIFVSFTFGVGDVKDVDAIGRSIEEEEKFSSRDFLMFGFVRLEVRKGNGAAFPRFSCEMHQVQQGKNNFLLLV